MASLYGSNGDDVPEYVDIHYRDGHVIRLQYTSSHAEFEVDNQRTRLTLTGYVERASEGPSQMYFHQQQRYERPNPPPRIATNDWDLQRYIASFGDTQPRIEIHHGHAYAGAIRRLDGTSRPLFTEREYARPEERSLLCGRCFHRINESDTVCDSCGNSLV